MEKQGTIVTSKCEGKGMEGMERVGEGDQGGEKILKTQDQIFISKDTLENI